MVTSGTEERQKIFDELHRRFLTEVPFVMIYNGVEASAFRKNVQGYTRLRSVQAPGLGSEGLQLRPTRHWAGSSRSFVLAAEPPKPRPSHAGGRVW